MKRIYLDHAATTAVAKEVFQAMQPFFSEKYGNASSLYSLGREAKEAIEDSRAIAAKVIGAEPREIIFTSGGSESDNMVLRGIPEAGDHIITSAFEHHAVLHTCQALEKEGVKVTYLPVTKDGFVRTEDVKKAITKNTKLISIMHANNEIGTIQPIAEIGKICRESGVLFHTDAVQTYGKIPIDIKNIDFLSASGHKLYGPKGIGCLYMKSGVSLKPLITGGSQEHKMRAGTENAAGIVGFGKASELAMKNMGKEAAYETKLRDMLIDDVLRIEDSWLNGSRKNRLPNNTNLGFDYIEGESIILHLDIKGIAASTGSACSSESLTPSHVLTAIGLSPVKAHGSLRMTLGKDNTKEEINYVLGVLPGIVENLRKISPMKLARR
ncbi:MAG: cysteine desulfurase NifS [Candidatus Aenigmarchaeota archaeon]|nr:cysteine desulfurase NifS [Candidatus Aenigmarchaeota archaeon]